MLGGEGAEAHGNRTYPSADVNVGVNYVTVLSYHSRPFASINLCSLGAVFSPQLATFKSFFPRLGLSKLPCLLATSAGGALRLSEPFQTLTCNQGLARSVLVDYCHLLGGPCLLRSRVSPLGRRFRQEGVAMKKPRKCKCPADC